MGLGQRLHGGLHSDGGGGLIRRPRLYEITTAISFGGRRRTIYDGLIELSAAAPGDRVLDVGCGAGYLIRRVARALGPGSRLEGIDPSPEMIAYATRTAPANATFLVGAAERLPQPDGTFDVVTCSLALHHIDPDRWPVALREMRRVLRPGGRLLIVEFAPPRNKIASRLIGADGIHDIRHKLIDQLPDLITDAGFVITGEGDRRHRLRYIQAISRS